MSNFFSNVMQGVSKRLQKKFHNHYQKAGLNWFKIKYLKHLPYNQPGTYDLNGLTIHFKNGPELFHSLVEIFVEDIYNIPFKTDSPYILDCGANIGLAAVYLKSRYPKATIVSFEPDDNNFNLLAANVNQPGWQGIEIRKEAIWKADCTLKFKSEGTLGSKINTESNDAADIEIKAVRLKSLLHQKIDFLKMDIEGAEYEVLKDCADELTRIENMFIEFHGHFDKMFELNTILDIIKNAGFSYYIKEATPVYATPFNRGNQKMMYDLQYNIFCFKQQ